MDIMNKIKREKESLLFAVIAMIETIVLYINFGVKLETIAPLTFCMVMIAYINSQSRAYISVISLFLGMIPIVLMYLLNGYAFIEAINYTGFELTLSLVGMIEMFVYVIIKENKKKTKIKIRDTFRNVKNTDWTSKILVLSILISIITVMYKTFDFKLNGYLQVLIVMQAIMPTIVALSIITFTDISRIMIIIYNIVYVICTVIQLKINGINIINAIYLINCIEFMYVTFKIAYNSYESIKRKE